jgi:hypothetical protein
MVTARWRKQRKAEEFIVCDLFFPGKSGHGGFSGHRLVRISFLLRPSFFSCFLLVVNGLVVGIARYV